MALEKEITAGSERIQLRPLHTLEEMKLCVALQEEIWGYGRPGSAFPYPDRVLFEFDESGGFVGGAFIGERMISFSFAWLGLDKRLGKGYLHSQLVGVLEPYRNSSIGYHLKLQQREYAREMKIELIKWTFDPTKTRNANLNLRKLGGVVQTYTPDYYGNLQSTFNKGLATDRFWAEWYVSSGRVASRIDDCPRELDASHYALVNKLSADADGLPRLSDYSLDRTDPEILVEMPTDFERLLDKSIEAAREWQQGLREIFLNYFGRGYVLDDLLVDKKEGTRIFYKLNMAGLEKILEPSAI